MRILFRTNSMPSTKDADYDVEDLILYVEMDYIPRIGDMIKVTPHGDYLKVLDTYWDITRPNMLEMQLESISIWDFDEMENEGWKSDG